MQAIEPAVEIPWGHTQSPENLVQAEKREVFPARAKNVRQDPRLQLHTLRQRTGTDAGRNNILTKQLARALELVLGPPPLCLGKHRARLTA
jgi:hypothetical protein